MLTRTISLRHYLRRGSLLLGKQFRRQRFTLALIPHDHHHHQMKIRSKTTIRQGHANMYENPMLTDWAWNSRLQRQNEVVGVMVPRFRPTATTKWVTARNLIETATAFIKNHLNQSRRLIILPRRTARPMAWISIMT